MLKIINIVWAAFWSLILFFVLLIVAAITFPVIGAAMIFSGDIFAIPVDNFHGMTGYRYDKSIGK